MYCSRALLKLPPTGRDFFFFFFALRTALPLVGKGGLSRRPVCAALLFSVLSEHSSTIRTIIDVDGYVPVLSPFTGGQIAGAITVVSLVVYVLRALCGAMQCKGFLREEGHCWMRVVGCDAL